MEIAGSVPAGRYRNRSVIPGFGLTLGVTLTWLSLIVLIPLASLFAKSATLGWEQFFDTLANERVLAALRLSFLASLGYL